MDGNFFYWILWIVWVVFMFFVPDTYQPRYAILLHLLAVMCLAAYELQIYHYAINISFVYLFIICCFYIRNLTFVKTIGFIFGCLIISLCYATVQLFALLDPIWVVVRIEWMMGILMNYLAIILFDEWKLRIFALINGMIIGDSLYAGTLSFNNIPYSAGTYAWMDMAALILLMHVAWVFFEFASRRVQTAIENQKVRKGTAGIDDLHAEPK
ncbi:YphA family membrane protein [Peribacillus glennii]|uniref:Uncharacterized protein n=1 Tax=Peribacillus glennii TaxID=2303991 RepID=A0A372LHV3_9BACI|nr:hypothetical protein [Peribacillus glennii]RFU65552.1 hypothetical protein D0466_06640 [Peribacillus glennii]